ncbi:MAG: phosphoglycerate dehydrogenase, partial [Victivallaceae bacterium]
MPSRLKVALIADNYDNIPEWVCKKLTSSGINFSAKKCFSEDELLDFAATTDVIWTYSKNYALTAAVLSKLKNLRAILRTGSGLDDIPVSQANALGIRVLNTPDAIAMAVAEHTVGLLISAVRQIPQHDRSVRHGEWLSQPDWANWHLYGQTLGLIGFGRIARYLVKMLSGFSLRVICHDPFASDMQMKELNVAPVSLENLLSESDYISLHCPLTTTTRHLIGSAELSKMKSNAILVNTSRGAVIDEQALIEALKNRQIGGAAIDVTENEPPAKDNPLLYLDNVIITPHVAAFSDEFERNFWEHSIKALLDIKNENKVGVLDLRNDYQQAKL